MSESRELDSRILEAYRHSAKSYVQLSSGGLALPLLLHESWTAVTGRALDFGGIGLIIVVLSWMSFLLAIGAALLYEYANIKYFEVEVFPSSTYILPCLKDLIKKRGPGELYGVMTICFYLGAICIVLYSFVAIIVPRL